MNVNSLLGKHFSVGENMRNGINLYSFFFPLILLCLYMCLCMCIIVCFLIL